MFARLLTLLFVVSVGGVESASAQPGRVQYDPNDPDKTRPVVSRAEREELGLAAKTWDGVVRPEVYTTLDRLNKTVERLKNTNTGEAIHTLGAVQFEGTVYVQVQLKSGPQGKADSKENRAALQDAQHRVLGSLTAAEFHVRQLFERSAGLVGQVSEEGLAKLPKHPDVVGVCLDDQPLPESAPMVYEDQLPDPEPGEFADEPGLKAGRVEVKVYQALKESDRVSVLVSLKKQGEPLPGSTYVPGAKQQGWQEYRAAVLKLQNRVLSTLTADDFWLWTRLGGAPGFAGYITREGLEKLWKHPEVSKIGVEGRIRLDPREMSPARPRRKP